MNPTSWLVRRPGSEPRLRLFCFPYCGGQATIYAGWQAALPASIEVCAVQLPGRGERMREMPLTSMSDIVGSIGEIIAGDDSLPFAFFGHSMGSLIAFETARHCAARGLPQPVHLFVSGCDAPQFRLPAKHFHLMDDAALIDHLKSCNGTPAELLVHRKLMEMVLPVLRADLRLTEEYSYGPGVRLEMPISILAGTLDDQGLGKHVDKWSYETSGPSDLSWFEGDHFFINSHREDVLNLVKSTLLPYCLPHAL